MLCCGVLHEALFDRNAVVVMRHEDGSFQGTRLVQDRKSEEELMRAANALNLTVRQTSYM